MCKKSWKRLKNLAFAVVLGTVLISALTVTAGAVVTEESGNGKALYNGVMLPKLPDYDMAAYPYAVIGRSVNSQVYNLVCSDKIVSYDSLNDLWLVEDGLTTFYGLSFDSDFAEEQGIPVGQWVLIGSFSGEDVSSGVPLWTNTDILNTDGTVYLSASAPIPLDGMNVITWDGDTTGLSAFPIDDTTTAYLVSDYEPAIDGVVVGTFRSDGSLWIYDNFSSSDIGWTISNMALGVSSYGIGACVRTTSDGDDPVYSSLIAYKPSSSELPPDEGGSDIDFSRTSLTINDFDIYDDSAEYAVSWAYLPDIPYPNNIQYYLRGSLSDYSFGVFDVYLGSSDDPPQALGPVWYDFTDLTPGTEYTFTAELLYTYGYSVNPTYLSSGVTVSDTFTTASSSDVSDGDKAIINAIDNANRDNQQWLDSNYGEAVGDLPEDTASTDAMIGDLDLKEEAYKNDAFARFQELSTAFTGFDGDIASGIGLAGTLFSRFFNALGTYKIIYTFPLLLGLALVIIGRLGRSGGPRSGRDSDVPGQFKMDGW